MHVTIAPLLVIIGAANRRFEWRRDTLLVGLGMVGLAISFLGAFLSCAGGSWAAFNTGQNTLEWFSGGSVWSEIEFNARVFSVWLKGGKEPVPWTPTHIWAWTMPPDAQPWKSLNLRDFADPQSFLLFYWKIPLEGTDLLILRICLLSAIAGPLLLLWVIRRTVNTKPAALLEDETQADRHRFSRA